MLCAASAAAEVRSLLGGPRRHGNLRVLHGSFRESIRVPLKGIYKGSIKGLGFWEFPNIRGTLLRGPYNKDPTI